MEMEVDPVEPKAGMRLSRRQGYLVQVLRFDGRNPKVGGIQRSWSSDLP